MPLATLLNLYFSQSPKIPTPNHIFNYFYTYNEKGNPDEYTYPSGYTIKNEYKTGNGALQSVKDKQNGRIIYAPGSFNARGQMNHFAIANKSIYTRLEYDEYGLPTFVKTGHSYPGSTNIQYLETNFDPETGNLTWRKDRKRNLTENFTYDPVHKNRLASWQVQGQQPYSSTYNNANGNILTKTDFTSYGNPYSYGLNAGPHAVTGVIEPLLMPAEAEQEIHYNSINKASRIIHHSQDLELVLHYGPDEQRIKTEYKINGQTTLTKYFPGGGLEVEVSANGSERWLHYLPGGGLYVCDENFDKIDMYYVLTDYLGSWDKVISETGSPIEEYSFDPWGRRRNPANWTYSGIPSSFIFARGYTGQVQQPFGLLFSANQLRMPIPQRNDCGKMLDAFGLVNMNGRMYDPVLGRMLSPDNYVSSPGSTQAFNRYSYALNNPLIITDPSGDHPALIAMIAYSAIVGGLSSAKNGDGFLQGFGTGVATGALSYGVGAAIGPVMAGPGAIPGMVNAGVNTAVSGTVTYGFDAIINNSPFNWKGWALNTGMAMAVGGVEGYADAVKLGLNPWTGKGIGNPIDMSASIQLSTDKGEPTGITGSQQLTDHTHSNYPNSSEYVSGTFVGVEGGERNPFSRTGFTVKNDQLYNINGEPIHGSTAPFRESMFGRTKSIITISPNMVTYSNNLHAVLGHEVIHAYHIFNGFMAFYGRDVSEYYALKFSASIPHATQYGANINYQRMDFALPFSHYSVYPSWVPGF